MYIIIFNIQSRCHSVFFIKYSPFIVRFYLLRFDFYFCDSIVTASRFALLLLQSVLLRFRFSFASLYFFCDSILPSAIRGFESSRALFFFYKPKSHKITFFLQTLHNVYLICYFATFNIP